MKLSPGLTAYALLIVATLCFGMNANFSKMAVGEVSPMLLVCLRWIGTSVFLLLIAGRRLRTEWPLLKPHFWFLITMGALGYTTFNALFYIAAHSTSALNMGIIQGSIPVFVLIGSFFLYRTRAGLLPLLGIAVTIAGVVLVTTSGDWDKLRSLSFKFGDILLIIACILYAGYSLGLHRCPKVDRLALLAFFAIGALAASIPFLAVEIAMGKMLWPTPKGWMVIGLVTVFPSFLAQLSFIKSIDIIGANRAGIFFNLVPVFAAIFAVSLLGEIFYWYHAVALALVLGGIGLSEWGKRSGLPPR